MAKGLQDEDEEVAGVAHAISGLKLRKWTVFGALVVLGLIRHLEMDRFWRTHTLLGLIHCLEMDNFRRTSAIVVTSTYVQYSFVKLKC